MPDIIIPELNGKTIDEFVKGLTLTRMDVCGAEAYHQVLERFFKAPDARFLRFYLNGYDEMYNHWALDNYEEDDPFALETFQWFPETDTNFPSFYLSMIAKEHGFFCTTDLTDDFEESFAGGSDGLPNLLYIHSVKKSWACQLQPGRTGAEELFVRR